MIQPEWINTCVTVYERTASSCGGDPFFKHDTKYWNPRLIIGADELNAKAKAEKGTNDQH